MRPVVHVFTECFESLLPGEAEVIETEQVLDTPQQCIIVIRMVVNRSGLDEARDYKRTDSSAPWPKKTRQWRAWTGVLVTTSFRIPFRTSDGGLVERNNE